MSKEYIAEIASDIEESISQIDFSDYNVYVKESSPPPALESITNTINERSIRILNAIRAYSDIFSDLKIIGKGHARTVFQLNGLCIKVDASAVSSQNRREHEFLTSIEKDERFYFLPKVYHITETGTVMVCELGIPLTEDSFRKLVDWDENCVVPIHIPMLLLDNEPRYANLIDSENDYTKKRVSELRTLIDTPESGQQYSIMRYVRVLSSEYKLNDFNLMKNWMIVQRRDEDVFVPCDFGGMNRNEESVDYE